MRKTLTTLLLAAASIRGQTSAATPLTLAQAIDIAIRNHPRIGIAQSQASSASERVREARSAFYPTLNGEVTGMQALDNSRLGAGTLSTSLLFSKFAAGLEVNQLVTDLGRTKNLVASSKLRAQAAEQNTQATRFDVILDVNRAYFAVLQAQEFIRVAEETLKARQTVADQVNALAAAQLKSQIDVSFAEVNVDQARLLLLRAQNEAAETQADLSRALGEDHPIAHELSATALSATLPPDTAALVEEAIQNRPELRDFRLRLEAARKFEEAEGDLSRPNVNLLAVGGGLPYLDQSPRVVPHEYEGVELNLEIPIFNGHLFSARRQAAAYEASAADQQLRDLVQQVQHDVRTAWLDASNAYQRIPVTENLLREARQALDLAQGRYNLGLASIVEVTQAQLNVTQAQIDNVDARYQYQSSFATLQYTIGALR